MRWSKTNLKQKGKGAVTKGCDESNGFLFLMVPSEDWSPTLSGKCCCMSCFINLHVTFRRSRTCIIKCYWQTHHRFLCYSLLSEQKIKSVVKSEVHSQREEVQITSVCESSLKTQCSLSLFNQKVFISWKQFYGPSSGNAWLESVSSLNLEPYGHNNKCIQANTW